MAMMSRALDLVRKPSPVGHGAVQGAIGFSILCVAIGIPLGCKWVYEYKSQNRKRAMNPKAEAIHDAIYEKMAQRRGNVGMEEVLVGTHRSGTGRVMDEATKGLIEETKVVPVGAGKRRPEQEGCCE